jgi:hypothetical protein
MVEGKSKKKPLLKTHPLQVDVIEEASEFLRKRHLVGRCFLEGIAEDAGKTGYVFGEGFVEGQGLGIESIEGIVNKMRVELHFEERNFGTEEILLCLLACLLKLLLHLLKLLFFVKLKEKLDGIPVTGSIEAVLDKYPETMDNKRGRKDGRRLTGQGNVAESKTGQVVNKKESHVEQIKSRNEEQHLGEMGLEEQPWENEKGIGIENESQREVINE